ncbi:transporter family-2 protein [Alkalithermobacter thermoalcaliphilus JW-YL-7 = DSM 7308]|uniref:Transporter family-2 protein n=1 Tax=Alkalithermobacter thermoalcaliphilus JW-YL-7 = DSM 7308 TaxID=1121328 RepID=A0A150FTB5_CLOPD|nr:protein of unknown function DUF606 [[Clostridium] paradoxum JW-YL-7 = DSM 7308]SHK33440.1 transporter family-2 protein [[Clostridium] paradoxum JW-YL-7 = DSM 7308]
MIYIIMSILAGVCVVLSRIVNFKLSQRVGLFQSTFFNYMVGLIFSIIFLFINSNTLNISIKRLPLWAYFGGAMGVLIVVLFSYITPKISSFYLTLFVFIGQIFVGIIIDYISLNTLSIGKIVGGVLVLIGLFYNLRLDNPSCQENIPLEEI